MPGKLGLPEILVLLAIALLIFGPSKLADLGKGLGEGIKNFKSAVKDGEQQEHGRQDEHELLAEAIGHLGYPLELNAFRGDN